MKTIDINRMINSMIETRQADLENLGELEKLLYIQLLQHYIGDLEVENLSLEIMNKAYEIADDMRKQPELIQPLPHPLPFPKVEPFQEVKPFPYKPSWIVTYGTEE
jgi:hypothetical protein